MSSTGTFLTAVGPEARDKVEETMRRNGVSASFLGKFTKNRECVLTKNNRKTPFPQVADDPYSKILALQM